MPISFRFSKTTWLTASVLGILPVNCITKLIGRYRSLVFEADRSESHARDCIGIIDNGLPFYS